MTPGVGAATFAGGNSKVVAVITISWVVLLFESWRRRSVLFAYGPIRGEGNQE